MLERYPKSQASLLSVSNFPVAKLIHWTDMILSFASTPYAQIFWTGLAPTVPGIATRFSIPHQLLSTVRCTKVFQSSPAPTSISTNSSVS